MDMIPWLIVAYLAICAGAYFGSRWFMFFPDPARIAPVEAGLTGVDEFELKTPDGETLVAWYAKARPGKATILYFHGNAGNAANRAEKFETMRSGGEGVFYLNNRGYGGSTGSPSENANVADAAVAYQHLRKLGVAAGDIVLYGESLGTGQAVRLGASHAARAVVLEAPLTSTPDVGRRTWFFLPLGLLLTDTFRNLENIRAVTHPVLVLHGRRDGVIPVQMGKDVFAAANEPKQLELFDEGAHSDLFDHGAWDRVRAFLEALPSGK